MSSKLATAGQKHSINQKRGGWLLIQESPPILHLVRLLTAKNMALTEVLGTHVGRLLHRKLLMHFSKIIHNDVVNGEGVRVSLFVSGCRLKCPCCFNKQQQNFKYGELFTSQILEKIKEEVSQDYITGLSVLGGEPLDPLNYRTVLNICKCIKEDTGKSVWVWTGYTKEELEARDATEIFKYIDVLVDGRYVKELREANLEWRGSSNQRVIYLNKGKI